MLGWAIGNLLELVNSSALAGPLACTLDIDLASRLGLGFEVPLLAPGFGPDYSLLLLTLELGLCASRTWSVSIGSVLGWGEVSSIAGKADAEGRRHGVAA